MVEIFGKLGIDGTIFFQFGIFLVLAVALNILLFKPLQNVLQDRDDKTTGLKGKADKILEEANQLKEETELKLTEARQSHYLDLKNKKTKLENDLNQKFSQSEVEAEINFNESLKELKEELSLLDDKLAKNTDELSGLLTSKFTK